MIGRIKNLFQSTANGVVSLSMDNVALYAKEKGISFQLFEQKEKVENHPPICLDEKEILGIQSFDSALEGVFLEIDHPKFYFSNHHLLDDENKVIYHLYLPFNYLPISRQKLPLKVKKLSGTIAYLSNTAPAHYRHFMRLVLPLLGKYQQFTDLNSIDYFYIGDIPQIPKFIFEAFEILGIPKEKIINFPCKADKSLIIITHWQKQANGLGYLDKASVDFVRNAVLSKIDLKHNCCYASKVYVARGNVNWRKVLNEAALFEYLGDKDFDLRVMDNLSILEQAQIFYHADLIVAPHGSALTNLIFGKPNAEVLEIFPYNYTNRAGFELAYYSQMQYFYQIGKAMLSNVEACYEDLEIDLKKLEVFLKKC